MNHILTILLFVLSFPLCCQNIPWDEDQDAMPHYWELFRAPLDDQNPKDAWEDIDKDGIPNLYEYILGSDPNDASQPLFVDYDGLMSLEEVLNQTNRGVVLRIPEGDYPLNFSYRGFDDPPRILIQGGWNTDFTERDYCQYVTTFDGGNKGSIFDFLISEGNSSSLILDGITFKNATRGAIRYINYLDKSQLLIANCKIIDNAVFRGGGVVYYESASATIITDFIMVNSTVSGNEGTAIYVVPNGSKTNVKLLHSVVAYNDYTDNDFSPYISGNGIEIKLENEEALNIQFANSIFWENANQDVVLNNRHDTPLAIHSESNIYGSIESPVLIKTSSDRNFDPGLVQDNTGAYILDTNSPARQSGIDIGYYQEVLPNIGTFDCDQSRVTSNSRMEESPELLIFPNPVKNYLYLQFDTPSTSMFSIQVVNQVGQVLIDQKLESHSHVKLNLSGLSSGMYYLTYQSNGMLKRGFRVFEIID